MKKYNPIRLIKYIIITIVAITTIIPMVMSVSASFTAETYIMTNGFPIFPKDLSLNSYRYVMSDFERILSGYKVTGIVTIVGTFLSVIVVSMLGYSISRKDVPGYKIISFYVLFTMLFHGGMVPWYITITKVLGLRDSYLALILPLVMMPFFVFIMRSFFSGIPVDFRESAYIDGAGEFKIFFSIIVPLSLPGMATLTLFAALRYWNDWWLGLMLINSRNIFPLQLILKEILSNADFLMNADSSVIVGNEILPSEGAKMVTCVVTTGPIILVYPFIQK